MPPFSEVRLYLSGLRLLIAGDARGLRPFDISDRGLLRSFLAIAWCAPAILVGWILQRVDFVLAFPEHRDSSLLFFAKMVLVEAAVWVVPALALIVLAPIFQFMSLLRILIVVRNWFAVPLTYATHLISGPAAALSRGEDGGLGFAAYGSIALSLTISATALVISWRILATIMGGKPLIRFATLGLAVLSQYLAITEFEKILGVYVP